MVFQLSLSNSKSPQVSRTLLSFLADLNNAVVWMVSIRPLISKFFGPFINPLVTITIGINVSFMFHSFFNSLVRSRYLSFFSFSFNFTLWSAGTGKSLILQVIFFCFFFFFFFFWLTIIRSGRLAESRGLVYMSKSQKSLCACHSPGQMLSSAYTICSNGQIEISCTIHSRSLCPPSHVSSYTLSEIICYIR